MTKKWEKMAQMQWAVNTCYDTHNLSPDRDKCVVTLN